jgi:hypothetical protein
MELLSPNLPDPYSTLDDLCIAINTFSDPQGYAVVKILSGVESSRASLPLM